MALDDLIELAEQQAKQLANQMDELEEVEVGMLDAFNRLLNTYRRLVQTSWIEKNRRY